MFGFIKSSFCGFINHKTSLSLNSDNVMQPYIPWRIEWLECKEPPHNKETVQWEKRGQGRSKISPLRSRWCNVDAFFGDEPGVGLSKVPLIIKPPLPGQPVTDAGMDMQKKINFLLTISCQRQLLWQQRTGVRRLNKSCNVHLNE